LGVAYSAASVTAPSEAELTVAAYFAVAAHHDDVAFLDRALR